MNANFCLIFIIVKYYNINIRYVRTFRGVGQILLKAYATIEGRDLKEK